MHWSKWLKRKTPVIDCQPLAGVLNEREAKSIAARIVKDCERVGHRFRPGVQSAIDQVARPGKPKIEIERVLMAYRIVNGIRMPWGVTVQADV